jgi:hypothetical protein
VALYEQLYAFEQSVSRAQIEQCIAFEQGGAAIVHEEALHAERLAIVEGKAAVDDLRQLHRSISPTGQQPAEYFGK